MIEDFLAKQVQDGLYFFFAFDPITLLIAHDV